MPRKIEPLVQRADGPQHYVPPSPRELRAQAIHRLQVGFFGLAAMILLVALANVINDRVRQSDAQEGTVAAGNPDESAGAPGDPLADIGVVPAADPPAAETATEQATTGQPAN